MIIDNDIISNYNIQMIFNGCKIMCVSIHTNMRDREHEQFDVMPN